MVRRALTILSPAAALLIVWASGQSIYAGDVTGSGSPPAPGAVVPLDAPTSTLLPDLGSVSEVIAHTVEPLDPVAADVIPQSIRRVLRDQGAVLLVPATGESR